MTTIARKLPIKYRRGRPIPELRHGDVLDFTTWPLHSKPNGRPIETCPECGRKGERTRYGPVGGLGESYTHASRFESFFWMVLDSCDVPGPSGRVALTWTP